MLTIDLAAHAKPSTTVINLVEACLYQCFTNTEESVVSAAPLNLLQAIH
jgi:hypothetical protein